MKKFIILFQHKQDADFKVISAPFQVIVEMTDYQDADLQRIAAYGVLQRLHPNDKMTVVSVTGA